MMDESKFDRELQKMIDMTRMRIWLLFALMLLCESSRAQLRLSGTVLSDGPVDITYAHASDGNRYSVPIMKTKEVSKGDFSEWKTKFKMPYWLEKNYSYAIRFTDGTVDKLVIIHGPVPEGIWPKQKVFLDINLLDSETAGETMVLYWSVIQDEYVARPLSEIERINAECYRPLPLEDVKKMNGIVVASSNH
jgi:hypothetical protein